MGRRNIENAAHTASATPRYRNFEMMNEMMTK